MGNYPRAITAVLVAGVSLCAAAVWGQASTGRAKTPAKFLARARALEAKEQERETSTSQAVASHQVKYTRAREIAWHLAQGQDAWNRHDRQAAYAQWREVLRLDKDNTDAMTAIRGSMVEESRHALQSFAQARGITAIAESLDDATDDGIAQRLIIVFRNAIQRVDGSANHSPDFALYDDFENYIDSNGLGRLVSSAEMGQFVDYYAGRLYGRKFLESLAPWVQRVEDSGIYVHVIYPINEQNAADHLDNCHFTIEPTGEVTIDGPDIGPDIPIEAVWQEGDYRIAPRVGYRLLYQFETQVKARRWRRT